MNIRRLNHGDAAAIVDCFRRVYGESYANELFYDPEGLAGHMRQGRLGCVGAVDDAGTLLGHMAMSVQPGARVVELGNTAVAPEARGQGLAWRIGAVLKDWCVELGYRGYLHYPTTDHHIMQRQSVKQGFEVGLMLGYIPEETHGQVGERRAAGRQAATIVYEALGGPTLEPERMYLPGYAEGLVRQFARDTELSRNWRTPGIAPKGPSETTTARYEKRGLVRMRVARVGEDLRERLEELDEMGGSRPGGRSHEDSRGCWQVDFSMDDPGIDIGVEAARALGYWFCGWLPGFATTDVYRMQKVDRSHTDMAPNLVNPVARSLLDLVPALP